MRLPGAMMGLRGCGLNIYTPRTLRDSERFIGGDRAWVYRRDKDWEWFDLISIRG